MTPKFVQILVEEHDAIPEGCCLRFKIVTEPRAVCRVRYQPDGAPTTGVWHVESRGEDESPGPAWAADVEDSGAGVSTLIYGASRGLRLHPEGGGETVAEAYLLLSHDAVIS